MYVSSFVLQVLCEKLDLSLFTAPMKAIIQRVIEVGGSTTSLLALTRHMCHSFGACNKRATDHPALYS